MRTAVWTAVLMLILPIGAIAQDMDTAQNEASVSAEDQAGPAAADVESDWNDFLHYTLIGRFDLAEGFGQRRQPGHRLREFHGLDRNA